MHLGEPMRHSARSQPVTHTQWFPPGGQDAEELQVTSALEALKLFQGVQGWGKIVGSVAQWGSGAGLPV